MKELTPPFKPINNGFGINPIGHSPIEGDVYDTFGVDKEDNIVDGHTTISIQNGQSVKLHWDFN